MTAAIGSPERTDWDTVYRRYKGETEKEHEEVVQAGGLHIVGTERHESRRIDNQLRGRAGRQGDPGSSRFYLSLQDDLLRIFGGDRMQRLMLRLGMEEDVPIESRLITKRIAAAQKAVEAQHFAARKHILEYDDVMNKQRQAVYGMRRQLLDGTPQKDRVLEMVRGIVGSFIDMRLPEKAHPTEWDLTALESDVLTQFGVKIDRTVLGDLSRQEVEDSIYDQLVHRYEEKEHLLSPEVVREAERILMLNVIDSQWKDHLLSMDHLKEGIGLRGSGQKDPLVEYKKESFQLFQDMMDRIEDETVRYLYFMQTADPGTVPGMPFDGDDDDEGGEEVVAAVSREQKLAAQSSVQDFTRNIQRKKEREMAELQFVGGEASSSKAQPVLKSKKPGRNDPCSCGSGKKYKKCCGA
jgi:preprotein translocase subunit SecA